jgi:hypothetical protein
VSNDGRRSRKAVILWLALLVALELAPYFANVAKGVTNWEALRHVLAGLLRASGQVVVAFGILFPIVFWLARQPLRCKRCGARREPDGIFCDACDPMWKPGIAVVIAIGLLLLLVHVTEPGPGKTLSNYRAAGGASRP